MHGRDVILLPEALQAERERRCPRDYAVLMTPVQGLLRVRAAVSAAGHRGRAGAALPGLPHVVTGQGQSRAATLPIVWPHRLAAARLRDSHGAARACGVVAWTVPRHPAAQRQRVAGGELLLRHVGEGAVSRIRPPASRSSGSGDGKRVLVFRTACAIEKTTKTDALVAGGYKPST
jgi:hypothetical protein